MDNFEKDAACAIREVLIHGGSLEAIAKELGKLAILYPLPCLPLYKAPFDAQVGIEMGQEYIKGITHIERLAV
jgi:hypothetical protein